MKMQLTKHARNDRVDRIMYIAENVGWGEPVFEFADAARQTRSVLTSTGVIIIKNYNVDRLITAYVGRIDEVKFMYASKGYNRIPEFMYSKVMKNKKHLPYM